jgi:WhiB family redox-sensing transcriptional regulator
MALSSQIEAACRTETESTWRPIGGRGVDEPSSLHLLHAPRHDRLLAALEREQVRWTVRRMANRHGCTGRCDAPEHARDVAELRQMLDILGLLNDEPEPTPEPEPAPETPRRPRAVAEFARAVVAMQWSDRAACLYSDPDLFYPRKTVGPEAYEQNEKAKKVCRDCPVIRDCFNWAMRNREKGVWGGASEVERDRIRRKRQRAARENVA